jgi:hypothetical protein
VTRASMDTYEESQPWVCYRYGLTHDGLWPFWSSTRFLGRSRIQVQCCVCGVQEVLTLRIPRWGKVPEPVSGRHPLREKFCADHAHPDRGAPMSWVRPLWNPAVFGPAGMSLDALALRLEADINEGRQS